MPECYPKKCPYKGNCFARGSIKRECTILIQIPQGGCDFQKAEREITNGVFYRKSEERKERYIKIDIPDRKPEEWAKEWDKVTARLRV